MALKEGGEHYTAFRFAENGDVKNRRLHRIEFQDRTGRVHILEGKDLPNLISVSTGTAQKGHHVGTILLEPEKATSSLIPKWEAWPTHRDVLNGLAAVVLFMMLQRFVQIASALPWHLSVNAHPPFLPGSEKESAVFWSERARGSRGSPPPL